MIVGIVSALGIIATVFFVSFLLAIVLQEALLALVGVILAFLGIRYLVLLTNGRDDPRHAKRPPEDP